MSLRLKACERCHGDLALEKDLGAYEAWVCIQCGRETADNGQTPTVYRNGNNNNFDKPGRQRTIPRYSSGERTQQTAR